MAVLPYGDRVPRIDPAAYVAPGAWVVGDVVLEAGASVWFNAVLRGDSDAVRVGRNTNVQDGAVLHTDPGFPCLVGEECTVGHGAVVHGCRVGRRSLVGMGAIVLSGAEVGEESVVAAGAVVPPGTAHPPRSLLMGAPARRVRELTEEDLRRLVDAGVRHYLEYAAAYGAGPEALP
jgi:carbonic anhydrase/acetyltransferase-like protein (isoleucine patch superfamily)